MKVKNISKRAKMRISLNNKNAWFVERVIYRMCSKTAQKAYELSKANARRLA